MSASKIMVARLWPWLLSLLILLPVLGPGFVLSYDMVFVPDLAFRSDFLGLGSSLPRAVPSDAFVAIVDELLPGDLLQKVVLVAALGLAGTGARRLVPSESLIAQLAATTLYVWSPLVAERLGIGHWPLLLTYAALPWIYDAARRARTGDRTLPQLVLWLGVASLSAAGGVIAVVFALSVVAGRHRDAMRRSVVVAMAAVAVNAPWLVAGALHGSGALSDPRGVEAFAARGEGLLPLPLTLLGLGGIWNAEVVPTSREGWAAVVQLVLVLGVIAVGVRRWRFSLTLRDRLGLGMAAGAGVAVAMAGSVSPDALGWVVGHVPGGGLFRDGSRFVALLAPLVASLFGIGVAAVSERLSDRPARIAVGTLMVLAPVALMPDLGLALAGRLQTVDFPQEYTDARGAIQERQDAGIQGDVLLLPFNSYRLPDWNGGRRTLDPLGRFLTPNYLTSDMLYVSGAAIPGEDERAGRVGEFLGADLDTEELSRQLGEEGIAWVVLDAAAAALVGNAAPSADLTGMTVVHDGPRLVIWELPHPVSDEMTVAARVAIAAAWCAALAVSLASVALVASGLVRKCRNMARSK